MILLAIDTSGPSAGVAVLRDGQLVYEAAVQSGRTHSVNLMPLIDEAYTRACTTVEQTDAFAVTVGPGSFTGVRIGVSCVKTLAHVTGKPCVAVDALEALAAGTAGFDGVICPIQDARAGQVYGAAFEGGTLERLMDDEPMKIEEYCDRILAFRRKALFLGDGVRPQRANIERLMGDGAVFAPAHILYLRPAAVAFLAARDIGRAVDYTALSPLYLRAPQAERQRNLQEAANRV